VAWGCCWLLVVSLIAGPARADQADDARRALDARPADLDARVRYAIALSWRGDWEGSRREAERVLERAPRYWDAHLLLARLDGWAGQYQRARARLQLVLKQSPSRAALLQAVDVELWDRKPAVAQGLLDGALARDVAPEVYLRRARVALLQLHPWRAYRLVRRALELDPVNRPARELRDSITLVSADLAYQAEVMVGADIEDAHSEILTVTALPRAFVYLTLLQEFYRRFGTSNHRLSLQGDWRITPTVQLTLLGGFAAPAQVIADGTASVRIAFPLLARWDAAIGYTYDHLPLPGALHRIRLDQGFLLPMAFRLEVAYVLGILAEQEVGTLHGVQARLYWTRGRFDAYVQYAYGMELYYPTPWASQWMLFKELHSHEVGFQVMGTFGRWTVRGGYGATLRNNSTEVHALHLALRRGF